MRSNYRRNSLRLIGFDYSRFGAYFVTMCTKDREPLFGSIKNGLMVLSEAGEIASKCWNDIPSHFQDTKLDEFIVMPDHLHGIILINEETKQSKGFIPGGAIQESPRRDEIDSASRRKMLIPMIIGRFKQNSAKKINILRRTPGNAVWQRGYHDHVIRDADSLSRIRQYILSSPRHWNSSPVFVTH